MPTQRWFAGKGARILDLAIVADTELVTGDPALRHLIIDVSQGSSVDSYQVFAGLRKRIPERLDHAVIGPAGAGTGPLIAYDALHDPDLTRLLLNAIATGEQVGQVRFASEPGATIDTDLDSLVRELGGKGAKPQIFRPRKRGLLSRLPRIAVDAVLDAAEERRARIDLLG